MVREAIGADRQQDTRRIYHHEAEERAVAKRGDVIEHPVTGERFTFLETREDTDGEYSRIEARVIPHGFVAAAHVHPLVEETFEIRAGTWAFVVDGKESRIEPGGGASIPMGTPHAWWNAGEEEGVAIVEFRPALKADEFFESFFGLAQDGKVSPKTGLPNLLWMALILRHYRDFLYLARPSLSVQRAVFAPLAAVARLLGYGMPRPYPYPERAGARDVRKEVGK
jgi:mannose-6-phosphate isomerase-like protein (cupin superfamily)